MKRINSYYFDTYTLIELGKENPNYNCYKNNIKIVLNKLNIMDFLFRENRKSEVQNIFNELEK